MLTARDQVILTNLEDHPLRFTYDGHQYGIPPAASVHIPFEVLKKEFGDPRSGPEERLAIVDNEKIRINSRAKEIERLDVKYGVNAARLANQQAGGDPIRVTIQDVAPKISATTVDGVPIATVVGDPGGDTPMAIPIDLDSPEALGARVAQMQKDLEATMSQLQALERKPVDKNEDVPEDSPSAGKATGAAKRAA
jgi:hypothetical protein